MSNEWSFLANRYRSSSLFEGQHWRFQSGMIGVRDEIDPTLEALVPFRASLTLGANSEGLHLSVFPLFRLGRPALFIPWSEISASAAEGTFFKRMKLDFRSVPRVSLYISDRLGRELVKQATWYSVSAT